MKYIPILILDQDDTPLNDSMSLHEFLEEIHRHVANVDGATLDNVFVTLHTVEYEDENFYDSTFAEIQFSMRRDDDKENRQAENNR